MNSRAYIRSRSGSRDGIALVIVLAFIVLLTILIVSFIAFTRLNRASTASYSKAIQAQEIAQGGLQDILSDLHQEIVAGSTAQTNGNSAYAPVYVPTTNITAQPARLGYAAASYGTDITSANLPPTLVRVSRASQDGVATDFYPALNTANYPGTLPLNRASAANSSTNSISGRSISAARWNKIALLSTNSTIAPAFATNTPDWVYVTRGGSRALTFSSAILPSSTLTSTNAVVGRYAYAVYDEGALLDINTAGYISYAGNAASGFSTNVISTPSTNNPAGIAQNLNSKSYLAYADLTQLPGFTTTGAQTNVDNLVKWRNASASMNTASTAATNYYQMVFTNAKNGFLSFQSNGTGTDSPLLGRQDLINYFAKIDPNGTSYSAALPFLGTFSRANNAPSWNPTADSQNLTNYYGFTSSFGYTFTSANFGNVAYKDNAETNGTANRDIPNVRYQATETITHYNDDGTTYTYTVNAGDPLVQHRFSLAKLAWLTYEGPSADLPTTDPLYRAGGTDANILACFGLQWDPESYTSTPYHYDRWKYVAATTASPVHIETLDEVAAGSTNTANTGFREPNFFELLKAGILSGSLGQSPGPNPTGNSSEGVDATGLDTFNIEKNRHILQIGANIIDQFDADSIPSAIYLQLFGVVPPATSMTNEADLAYNTVYGDENLPGLAMLDFVFIEDWYDTSNKLGYFKLWTYPEIWNIHQTPPTNADMTVSGTPGYPRPTQFRLHAYGKIDYKLNQNGGSFTNFGNGIPPPMDYDDTAHATPYTYHTPTGTSATIYGGEIPSSVAVSSSTAASSSASLLYFTDIGSTASGITASASAKSPFYKYPQFLQFQNLYFNGNINSFVGTNPLNLSSYNPASGTGPYSDYFLPSDGTSTWNGNAFAAIFGGEYTLPDMSTPAGIGMNIQENLTITNPFYIFVECQDPNTLHWHPCSYISQLYGNPSPPPFGISNAIMGDNSNGIASGSPTANFIGTPGGSTLPTSSTTGDHAANGITNQGASSRGGCLARPDPRTDRFSLSVSRTQQSGPRVNSTFNPGPGPNNTYKIEDNWPSRTWGFVYSPDAGSGFSGLAGANVAYWAVNTTSSAAFYVDPDGVVRPADGFRQNGGVGATTAGGTGDGCLLYHGATTSSTAISTSPTSLLSLSLAGAPTGSAQARRPVILNRPFRSVGELGYVFRDLPFKTLDFWSSSSGDGALLDLFSVTDEPNVAAGEINVSNAPASILTAILTGATKMEINNPAQAPNFMSQAESSLFASLLATGLQTQPLGNRADLVKMIDPVITSKVAVLPNYRNKAYGEAPVRALSNVANTRTWNLLIDIIAQSGQMSPTAASLNDFVVQGERRYWLHIAIDRYTGKIIDQQLESVYE